MRKFILLLAGLNIFYSAVDAQMKTGQKNNTGSASKTKTNSILKNGNDSLSYAVGMSVGNTLKGQGVDKINSAVFMQAMNDALAGKTLLFDDNTAQMTLQEKLQAYQDKKVNVEKEKGRAFLAKNKKEPGVTELPNGIQYVIIKQGTGIKPKLEDTIKVHYRGTTIDGAIFDESYARGEPIEFPLDNLIEGWKQTLVLMPVGSKWKIFLPSDYAYGDYGQGSKIPGGAMLMFELELLDVKPLKN
jgi:FKBP-type peptidyl-prolyl cis-trans isomerase FklB